MRHTKLRNILAAVLLPVLFLGVLMLTLDGLVKTPSVQHYILRKLGRATAYRFEAGKLRLTFRGGIGFHARDLVAESQADTVCMKAAELKVALDVRSLFRGRIVPSMVWIYRPRIEVIASGSGRPGKTFDFGEKIFSALPALRFFSVSQGSVRVRDFPFSVEELSLDVQKVKKHPDRLRIHLHGRAVSKQGHTPLRLLGFVSLRGGEDRRPAAYLNLKTGYFPLTWIPWPSSVPFSGGTGEADIRLDVASGKSVTAKGKITMKAVQFAVAKNGRSKNYRFDHLQSEFSLCFTNKTFEISSLNLKGKDFSLQAKLKTVFENRSDPHLVLSVESPFLPLEMFKRIYPDPLTPRWVKEELLPVLSGGQVRLSNLSVNGTLDQLKHLHKAGNRDVISVKIAWKNLSAFRDRGGLPFDKITGGLDIEKGGLVTHIRHAEFGNSTVTGASLDMNSLHGPGEKTVSVAGRFDLQDLKAQGDLDFSRNFWRPFLERYDSLSGELEGRLRIALGPSGWSNPRIVDGKFHAEKCALTFRQVPPPAICLDKADILMDGPGETRFAGEGHWGDSGFHVAGAIDRQWNDCTMEVTSRVNLQEIVDRFFPGKPFKIEQQSPVPCHADVKRKSGEWSFCGAVALAGLTVKTGFGSLNFRGEDDTADFDLNLYRGERLILKEVQIHTGKSALLLNGSCAWAGNGEMDLRVSTKNMPLEGLGIRSGDRGICAGGILSCDARIKGIWENPLETSVTGHLSGRDISFGLDDLPAVFNDCFFTLDFLDKDIFIRSFHIRMGKSLVDGRGHVKGWDGLTGGITANADYLNLDDFTAAANKPSQKAVRCFSPFGKTDIEVTLSAGKAKWKSLMFSPLKANFGFLSTGFFIRDVEAELPHGSIHIYEPVEKEPESDIGLVSDIKMTNQPVDDIIHSLGLKNSVDGALSMEAHLSTSCGTLTDMTSGLSGKGKFELAHGVIKRKRGAFFKVLEFLSLRNIVQLKMPDLAEKGFAFEKVSADFTIRDGEIETDNLVFESPAFNAAAQGTVSLPGRMVDLDLWIQTLGTMDSIVSRVPIIGYILTGKEKSPKGVFIYPVEVKGNWSDPEIESSVLKNLGGGVVDIFKRILLTPGHIFKQITDITTGWSDQDESGPADKAGSDASTDADHSD
ncbi:MAG: hypothetical protein DRH37_03790 [Deltaproteobacteria bacterium]|nr:MAG: hypothetical protein DRH37_03790 [Deltaproteobacteria bacterium]